MKRLILCLALLFAATSLYAQDPVRSLGDLVGERAIAIDSIEKRGYTHVRTEKSETSAYSYWTHDDTGRCVVARVTNGRIASIVYSDGDCGTATAAASSSQNGDENADTFRTVCGVIRDGKTYRYRCKVEETESSDGSRISIVRMPDNEMTLHWHREGHVGVDFPGMKTLQATYSTSEGETDIFVDDATYFYVSDRRMARLEHRNFQD